jgi:hypothetical protein
LDQVGFWLRPKVVFADENVTVTALHVVFQVWPSPRLEAAQFALKGC